jgi:hypothetical protein
VLSRCLASSAVALLAVLAPHAAVGQSWLPNTPPAERRVVPYTGEVPSCVDDFVFAQIQRDFGDRESEFWNSALQLDGFLSARETGHRTNGLSFIPRRYCEGSARFNDGATRKVVYSIGEGLGFIGFSWGVEWCVVGLDRNYAYAPNCKAAGP